MSLTNSLKNTITCPITLQIFYRPVIASDGMIYEYDAIKNIKNSPITNKPLEEKFYEAFAIKSLVDEYLAEYPDERENQHTPSLLYDENIVDILEIIKTKTYEKLQIYKDFNFIHMGKYVIGNSHFKDNWTNGKNTILIILLRECSIDIMKYIIDNINDLEAIDINGNRMIHWVCRYGNPSILEYLLGKNVEIDPIGKDRNVPSINCFEIFGGDTSSMIKLLIDKGANLTIRNNDNHTCIHYICQYMKLDLFLYAINFIQDMDFDMTGGEYDRRLIFFAIVGNNFPIFKFLVDKGIDLDAPISPVDSSFKKLKYGYIVHSIARYGRLSMYKYIEDKINESQYISDTNTLQIACRYTSSKMIKYLMNKNKYDITKLGKLLASNKNITHYKKMILLELFYHKIENPIF